MEKEYKELIEATRESVKKSEEKIEALNKDFTEDASEFWNELKQRIIKIKDKLEDAEHEFNDEAELQTHLSIMEARDRLEVIRDSAENFMFQISKKTEKELDISELKAHLVKMEAEDKWEETKKELSHQYAVSKADVELLAKKAGKEINEILLKLTEIV